MYPLASSIRLSPPKKLTEQTAGSIGSWIGSILKKGKVIFLPAEWLDHLHLCVFLNVSFRKCICSMKN